MKGLLAVLILLGYLATLAVSSWHLAEWYALSRGSLPPWLSFALAVTLEANAFILSLLSNSLLRRSVWAHGGSLAALTLVWVGNYLSMRRAAPELSPLELFAASMFVPIGTYVMAKVLGELLAHPPGSSAASPDGRTLTETSEVQGTSDLEPLVLELLREPRRTRELGILLPEEGRRKLPELLERLERAGLIRREGAFWARVYPEVRNEGAAS